MTDEPMFDELEIAAAEVGGWVRQRDGGYECELPDGKTIGSTTRAGLLRAIKLLCVRYRGGGK